MRTALANLGEGKKALRRLPDLDSDEPWEVSVESCQGETGFFTLDSLKTHQTSVSGAEARLKFNNLKKLYGREQELKQLSDAFRRVGEPNSKAEVVMIHGVPGVGKSALVQEWKESVVETNPPACSFLQAQCEETPSPCEPLSVIKTAFSQLLNASNEDDLGKIRAVLKKESLGKELESLQNVLTSFEKPFGEVNADEQEGNEFGYFLSSTKSGNNSVAATQLGLIFIRVLRAVCQPSKPIILLLGDIQWADEDLLDFISSLMVALHCANFMMVCTFRVQGDRRSSYQCSSLSVDSLRSRWLSRESSKSMSQARFWSSSRILVNAEQSRVSVERHKETISTQRMITKALSSQIMEEDEEEKLESSRGDSEVPQPELGQARGGFPNGMSIGWSRIPKRDKAHLQSNEPAANGANTSPRSVAQPADTGRKGPFDVQAVSSPGRGLFKAISQRFYASTQEMPTTTLTPRTRAETKDSRILHRESNSDGSDQPRQKGSKHSLKPTEPPPTARHKERMLLSSSLDSSLDSKMIKSLPEERQGASLSDTSVDMPTESTTLRRRRGPIPRGGFLSRSVRSRNSRADSSIHLESRRTKSDATGQKSTRGKYPLGSSFDTGATIDHSSMVSEISSMRQSIDSRTSAGSIDLSSNVSDIELNNLDLDSINGIITVLLGCNPELCKSLSTVIHRKTHGNPYSVLQFLEMLQRDNYITYSNRNFQWEWSTERINDETKVATNVGELLAARIAILPQRSLYFLTIAACIGISFDIDILAKVVPGENVIEDNGWLPPRGADSYQATRKAIADVIRESKRSGLIEEEKDGKYRFLHDLVQKCLYSRVSKENLPIIHLRIGRSIEYKTTYKLEKTNVYLQANHMNLGAFEIENDSERWAVIRLNLEASRLAKDDHSFRSAALFLQRGVALVDYEQDWTDQYDLILEVHTLGAEVHSVCGNLEESLELAEEVFIRAVCIEDELRAHVVKVDVLGMQRRLPEALKQGFKALNLLGCKITRKFKRIRLFYELIQIRQLTLGKSSEEILISKPMTDSIKVYTLRLLDSMTLILWMMGRDSTVALLMTRMTLITLQDGISVYAPFSFASYGMLLSHFGEVKRAYQFGCIGLQLAERFKSRLGLSRTALIAYTFTNHLRKPLIDSLEPMLNAHRIGLQVGDTEYSSMCLSTYASLYIAVGLPLVPYVEDMKDFCEQLETHSQQQCVALMTPYWQFALNLIGRSKDYSKLSGEAMDLETFFKAEKDGERDDGIALSNLRLVVLLLAYVFQDMASLESWFVQSPKTQKGMIRGTHFLNNIELLFAGLAAFTLYRETGRKKYFKHGLRSLNSLNHLVKKCGINCSPLQRFLIAERQSFHGDKEKVRKCYDKAISTFARCGFIHLEALACERAGDFMCSRGDSFWPQTYYSRSRARYIEWQATAKAEQLGARHSLASTDPNAKAGKIIISMRGKRRYDPSTWAGIA